MVPGLVKRIAVATCVVALVGLLCILPFDRAAGLTFAFTTFWMVANLLVWSIIMRAALRPKQESKSLLILLPALGAKLLLLGIGIAVLYVCAPYTKYQIYGMVAGIASISVVAALKAMGARIASRHAASLENAKAKAQARA
jgi:hypothetical protein